MNTKPLFFYKHQLVFRAVRIEILDADKKFIAPATGFILKEDNQHYLYTCWHVVTGYDLGSIKIGLEAPKRSFLKIDMQDYQERQEGVAVIGGKKSFLLDLYDQVNLPRHPLWLQDRQHIPHPDLNGINIRVPFWHDAVKFKLPEDFIPNDMQVIPEEERNKNLINIGDKVYICGYPYGFSSAGLEQPTPIVITRHIASDRLDRTRTTALLDGPCAPGMSGAPVFLETNNKLFLAGIYMGSIFPDHYIETNNKETALGRFCNLNIAFTALPFVEHDSELVNAQE